jgi:hypothetical protein
VSFFILLDMYCTISTGTGTVYVRFGIEQDLGLFFI